MDTPANIADLKYDRFLVELAKDGNVARAAGLFGIDRSNAYQKRLKDPDFAQRWADALETAADIIEAEAFRRAVTGTDKGVWFLGRQVGAERQYSDSLLALMLKAKRRREYGDSSKVELTGADGGPVKIDESPMQSARKIAFALALGLKAAAEHLPDGSDLG